MNDVIQFVDSNDELVYNNNGKTLTNSLLVAQKFGKNHRDVLEAIRKIVTTAENSAVLGMFAESQYVNDQNKEQPMFIMNRDGFTLLAMGFTGKRAMQFKLDYIAAFNKMESAIKKPMSELEILVQSAQALLEQSKRIDNVENRLDSMEREREENRQLLLAAELSEKQLPEEGEKEKIRKLVDQYHKATGIGYKEIWDAIYATMEYRFRVRVKRCDRIKSDKSWFDVAIRNNHGEKIFIIISDMVRNYKNK